MSIINIIYFFAIFIAFWSYYSTSKKLLDRKEITGKISNINIGIDIFIALLTPCLTMGMVFLLMSLFPNLVPESFFVFLPFVFLLLIIYVFYIVLSYMISRHKTVEKEVAKKIANKVSTNFFGSILGIYILLSIMVFYSIVSYDGGNSASKSVHKVSTKCSLNQEEIDVLKTFFNTNDITYNNDKGETLYSEFFRNIEQSEEDFCGITSMSISSKYEKSIPTEIGKLVNLISLYISMDNLSVISSEIGNLGRLEHLSIENTQIQTLPSSIGKLQNLEKLELMGNNISSLPSEIAELKNLNRLGLSGNPKLGNLNTYFGPYSIEEKIQENVTMDEKSLSIKFEGYGVVIEIVE